MSEAIKTRLTADELFAMSFSNEKTELIRGEIIRLSSTGAEHGVVAMNIGGALHRYVKSRQLGVVCAAETGFIVARDPDTVRAPDAAFVSAERIADTEISERFWPFAPDLAVAVVSPGDTAKEIADKVLDWFEGGARMVWVFYPTSRTAHVHRSRTEVQILGPEDALSGEDVVPGFSCSVAEIFE